jgi:hypothetical protein
MLLLTFGSMVSQMPQRPQNVGNQPAWTEHYRKATISFGQVVPINGTPTFQTIGTGVFVCHDEHSPFLVTAKHVFSEPEKQWMPAALAVRFSFQQKQTLTESLGTPILLMDNKRHPLWSSLDDGSDIAVIPVPASFAGRITDCIGYQDFATEEDVFDGATVFTFGYPASGGVIGGPNALVRALTRSGIIAWTDPNGVLENPLLLDSTVLPGNSGGPAFKVPSGLNRAGTFVIGGRTAFLGIVTSALEMPVQVGDVPLLVQTPGSTVPSIPQVVGVGSLGRVEPALKVKKLIEARFTKQ